MNAKTTDVPNNTIPQLVFSVAQALVDDRDSVKVIPVPDGQNGLTIFLRVSSNDLGKVIGKQGRTARSLRTILHAASVKHQQRYSLNIEAAS